MFHPKFFALAACLLLCMGSLFAQTEIQQDSLLKDAPLVFVDCEFCDIDYMRQQIPYVNYVRDRKAAEVHVLATQQRTGSGGREYSFSFYGEERFSGMSDTLEFSTDVNMTNDEVRKRRVQMLKLGLLRYIAQTPMAYQMLVDFEEEVAPTEVEDPWNNWVFSLSTNAWFNGESSYSNFNSWSSADISKVTPEYKIELGANMSYRENSYDVGDATIVSIFRSQSGYGRYVKSITDHWSWGVSASGNSSLFNNYKYNASVMPGIEYNLFPYSESTRRELRLLYSAGPRYNSYHQTTLFYKDEEFLFNNALELSYLVQEKWGGVAASVNASSFLNDMTKYRVRIGAELNLRLVKGLSFRMNTSFSLIRDQINLPLQGASDEEILLQQRQLATGYSYWGSAGITYTFGSIYNSVVNPRFGQW